MKEYIQCFVTDDLPEKFIAIYSDGSGCDLFFKQGKLYYSDWYDEGVDKDWFFDAGYLWFIALPDNFEVFKLHSILTSE
jgi:hypothetical protein